MRSASLAPSARDGQEDVRRVGDELGLDFRRQQQVAEALGVIRAFRVCPTCDVVPRAKAPGLSSFDHCNCRKRLTTLNCATMRHLQQAVQRFNEERGWLRYHERRSLTLAMTEEIGEIAKLVAWSETSDIDALGLELADLLIYALSFANAIGVDAEDMVSRKLSLNSRRFPTDEQ